MSFNVQKITDEVVTKPSGEEIADGTLGEGLEDDLDGLVEDFQTKNAILVHVPISDVEKVQIHHQTLKAKYGIAQTYPAGVPGALVAPTIITKPTLTVLCVFLGPSHDTAAHVEGDIEWNPFVYAKDSSKYVKTLGELDSAINRHNSKFSLGRFFLTDAFPLLYWNGKNGAPASKDYFEHFNYGVDHVKNIIDILKPQYILSFGQQAGHVVEYATANVKLKEPIVSLFGTTGRYMHKIMTETKPDGTKVYYCKHPSARQDDKFDLVFAAITAISYDIDAISGVTKTNSSSEKLV